ncbi:ribonuclease T2 family protein [Altererythrobacter sp. MF3-039]|uniref:ribonuclease T2 family protein n=1 Tax=Altererythrobacter sp. MF3-039 TaxID=3252901 RepID=UPI00390C4127
MKRAGPALAAAAALLAPAQAAAQAYQCRSPERVIVPDIERDGPVRQLPISGYTMALSWSPEFCKGRGSQSSHKRQCSGREGSFGLIVHGLWPESGRTWPQWCSAPRKPRPSELSPNMCLTPSARLLAHEWAKHGSCMTRRPATYYKVTRILFGALRMPDLDRLSRRDGLKVGDLREQWHIANPGWRGKRIGVDANSRGWLREIKLCYGKDFKPVDCPRWQVGARDSAALKIWRGL